MSILNKMFKQSKEKAVQVIESEDAINVFFSEKIRRGYHWTQNKGLDFYLKSIYINRAIEKRAQKVSEINFYLQKGDTIIDDNPILDILAKPNSLMSGEQFIALWNKYYDLYGEVYIYKAKEKSSLSVKGNKFELFILDTSKVVPTFNIFGKLEKVSYGNTNYTAEEILYHYNPNPKEPNRGISLLRAGTDVIQMQIDLEALNANIIKNGGKVDGMFNFKLQGITKERLDEFKESYKKQLEEKTEYGDVIFMGGDAEYSKMGLTSEEIGYLNTKKSILNDICILTDVPKILLNSVDDVKYDNADASINMFLKETIKPLMRGICNVLNEDTDIVPEGLELKFVDPTPENIDLKLKTNENGSKNYYMTPNEMRKNINLDEIEGGDEILLPFNMSPSSSVNEQPKEEVKKKEFVHPLSNENFRRKYFTQRILKQDKQELIFYKALKKYFNEQKKRLIQNIGGEKSLDSIKKGLLDSSFNQRIEILLGKELLTKYLINFLSEAGQEAKEMADNKYDFLLTDNIRSSIDKRAEFFLESINETTFNKLSKEFSESVSIGEDRSKLIERINNTYDEISRGRAKTIARTEVHNIVNDGTLEGYKQAGMPIKIWVAVMDDKTRDEHAAMDGEERPIGVPFSNGLMYPNEINCRCQI